VSPAASSEEIREAYRRAARAHHPDRHGPDASTRMAEVNHAWHVLRDPHRRRTYDLSLRVPPGVADQSVVAAPTSPSAAITYPHASFPWRFLGVLAAMALAFVVLGVLTASDPKPPTVDNVLTPGDCVALLANGDAAERLCTEPHDAVVELLVPTGEVCPGQSEPHRDQQGMGTACVRLN
jgi:DnaJ domain